MHATHVRKLSISDYMLIALAATALILFIASLVIINTNDAYANNEPTIEKLNATEASDIIDETFNQKMLELKEQERIAAEEAEKQRLAEEQAESERLAAEAAALEEETYYQDNEYYYYDDGSGYYNTSGLTASSGVNYYNGRKETYYSSNVLYHKDTGQWTLDDEGCYRTDDGYYVVAVSKYEINPETGNTYQPGDTISTSKGEGMVLDCGCDIGTTDFYVNW